MRLKGHNMKDTYISLALSITAHLCIVMLVVGLSMGTRKLDKVVVVDLTFMIGQEEGDGPLRTPKKRPGEWRHEGGNGDSKKRTGAT